ncbi:hypothetical protein HPB48_023997 [Haemaphysalis longicornis]|uniref:Speckle-type POZ protein n=1 Tax=Haemaphysalis longicornis TaxID=44386 RepID=A0A9J6H680_HAELO|nr:hypothetical protein HPB48_023997 [Haemaphysalis longicornis]
MKTEASSNAAECGSSPEHSRSEVRFSCQTQVNVAKVSYTWTVPDFSKLPEVPRAAIESSAFSMGPDDPVRWCLELYPRGKADKWKEHVSLFLLLLSSGKANKAAVDAEFKFFVLDSSGNRIVGKGPTLIKFTPQTTWGYRDFVERALLFDSRNELLPDDKLTIYCEVRVFLETDVKTIPLAVPRCRLQQNLNDLFENQKFSDVTLNVGGREIKAHRNILAARSPVFAAMFDHDIREKAQSRVDITDVDYDTTLEMLRFIYTGRTPRTDGMADNLLVAADKYALEGLKTMCECALYSGLTAETAAETFAIADAYNCYQLKAHATDFINKNFASVMETAGWKSIAQQQPHVIEHTFGALASRQSGNDDSPMEET